MNVNHIYDTVIPIHNKISFDIKVSHQPSTHKSLKLLTLQKGKCQVDCLCLRKGSHFLIRKMN